jgi:hypothetical protein
MFINGDNVSTPCTTDHHVEDAHKNNAGFLWSTINSGEHDPFLTSSLMFLSNSAELFVHSIKSRFTSSISNGVGFQGTSSYALTASYFDGSTVLYNAIPGLVKALNIYPNWDHYDGEDTNSKIDIKAEQISVYNADLIASTLQNVNVTNDILNPAIGGIGSYIGTFTDDKWYDIYLVYKSTAPIASSSVVILSGDGTTPKQTTFLTDVEPTTTPLGYDYGVLIGSIYHENSGFWRKWLEYGSQTMFCYRNEFPADHTIVYDDIEHYLGRTPRNTNVIVKLHGIDSYASAAGFENGDEFSINNIYTNSGAETGYWEAMGKKWTPTKLKIWRADASNNDTGFKLFFPTVYGSLGSEKGGYWIEPSRVDFYIYAWV